MTGLNFLKTKQIPFESNTIFADIKFGVVAKEQDANSNSSLAASATKPVKLKKTFNLIPFVEFCNQKVRHILAYMLRLLESHENHSIVDGGIKGRAELDDNKCHLKYFVQGRSFSSERKENLKKLAEKSSRIALFTPISGPLVLVLSSGGL